MIYDNEDEVIEEPFESLLKRYVKLDWKHQWEAVLLYLTVFIYCITSVIKKSESWWIIYRLNKND